MARIAEACCLNKACLSDRELLRSAGKIAAIFTLLLFVVLLFTFGLAVVLDTDLRFP